MTVTTLLESGWRSLGYHPSVSDTPERWVLWYDHVCKRDSASIALIGSSRMQAGVSSEQLRRRLPSYRVAQLGRNGGGSPVGVLSALANEKRFQGIVVCGMMVPFLPRKEWERQGVPSVEVGANMFARFDGRLSGFPKEALAIKNGQRGLIASGLKFLQSGGLPPPDRVRIKSDRSLIIDFWRTEDLSARSARRVESLRKRYAKATHPAPSDLDDEVEYLNSLVQRIESRGGHVVFVRLPTSGDIRSIEENYHPRAAYWDRFAAEGLGTWLHFRDLVLEDGPLECPDQSHLDEAGATRFADALVDELLDRNIVALDQN